MRIKKLSMFGVLCFVIVSACATTTPDNVSYQTYCERLEFLKNKIAQCDSTHYKCMGFHPGEREELEANCERCTHESPTTAGAARQGGDETCGTRRWVTEDQPLAQ